MSNEIVTMLGVGATLLASGASFALFMFRQFVRLEGKMGGLEGRFGGLEGRFEGLESRFDGLESRFDGLEGRFDRLEGRFDGLESRFDGLEGRFDRLEGRFDGLEGSSRLVVRLEEKVDDLARDHQSLARELSEFRGEIRGRLGDLAAGSVTG